MATGADVVQRCFAIAVIVFAVSHVRAQDPDVALTIETTSIAREHGSIAVVTVRIPPGYFVPAETRGARHGAWMRPQDPRIVDWRLPTFPQAIEVSLPGSEGPMLAFRGVIRIRVPILEYLNSTMQFLLDPPYPLAMEFGHELCDPTRCSEFREVIVRREVGIDLTANAPITLAAHADDHRLVIFTPKLRPVELSLPFTKMASDPAHQHVAELPENHPARSDFVGEYAIGSRWTVTTGSRSLNVVANKPGVVYGACPDAMRSVLIADLNTPSTTNESGKYSVATSAEQGALTPLPSVARTTTLTDAHKAALDTLVRRQLRVTMPTIFAPKSGLWKFEYGKTDFDRRFERGEGQTVVDVQTFRPAPDGVDRLYVRAHWTFDGEPGAGINLWIRFDGRSFEVEQTDATAMRMTRVLADKYPDPDRPTYPISAGSDVSVLPASDGWAYLIRTIQGYEYTRIQLLKYSVNGPTDALVLFDYGC